MPLTRTSAWSLSEQATNGTNDTVGEAGLVPRFALFFTRHDPGMW